MTSETITAGAIIKNGLYIPALLLGLSPQSYLILTVFMVFDLILGISRSALLHGPSSIKSYKLTAGLISKLLILAVPLILVWSGKGSGFDFQIMGQWSIGILVLSQAYSILGHINAMRLHEDKTEWDAMSDIIGTIQKRLRNALEALIVDSHNKEV